MDLAKPKMAMGPVSQVNVTVHRRENFGETLSRILSAIKTLSGEFHEVQFTLPLHPNPESGKRVAMALDRCPNIALVPPMDYFTLVRTLAAADFVITDSGGLQEEAPSLAKPTIVLRESTERPELIDAGMGVIVGSDESLILSTARRLITDRQFYESLAQGSSPFGRGDASQRIARVLEEVKF